MLVVPRQLATEGLGSVEGRAALIHAVAHIEFNAVNLAWDAVYRFRDMPPDYYRDWIAVAVDEDAISACCRRDCNSLGTSMATSMRTMACGKWP